MTNIHLFPVNHGAGVRPEPVFVALLVLKGAVGIRIASFVFALIRAEPVRVASRSEI